MNLSKEMQVTIEKIHIEPSPVSAKELTDAFQLAMAKIADTAVPGSIKKAPKIKHVKTAYLIAAILAMLALMGAGYALSQYFKKMYSPAETPSTYDIEVDDPKALLNWTGNSAAARETVQLSDLGAKELESLFKSKTPGDLLQFEIQTPEDRMEASGIAGNALNILYTITSNGSYGQNLVINRETAPTTQQVIDSMIANGEFIATIDSPAYTPISYYYDLFPMLFYEDGDGTILQLYFERSPDSIGMPQDLYQNANTEDFVVNGNQFVFMDFGQFDSLELYVGKANKFSTTKIGINLAKRGDLDTYKALANSLTLHNASANAISVPDAAFFSSIQHPDIQVAATEIAGKVSGGDQTVAWEKGNTKVESTDYGKYLTISVKDSFQKDTAIYPYGAHTPLVDQAWFPKEQFTDISLAYDNMHLLWATYSGNDYSFVSKIVKNGYVKTALDAVLATMDDSHQYNEIVSIINAGSEAPMVLLQEINGNQASIYCAVKMSDGRYLAQILSLPKDALPGELLDR